MSVPFWCSCPAKVVGEGCDGERTHDRASMVWKRYLPLKMAIFGIYVSFLGCNCGFRALQPLVFQSSHLSLFKTFLFLVPGLEGSTEGAYGRTKSL